MERNYHKHWCPNGCGKKLFIIRPQSYTRVAIFKCDYCKREYKIGELKKKDCFRRRGFS